MDNQHKHIKGYRDLTAAEIALMNEGKELGLQIQTFLDKLNAHDHTDKRAVSIARTEMQTGLMWAIRSVAKPEGF